MHILGAPRQGKSKLLELLIRQDLERGFGACLLDPSDNGDTMNRILRWCAKTGFEKVCIIDPHDIKPVDKGGFNIVPAIAPRHNVMETVRILFGTKDASETPVIEKYLSAILYALRKSEMTLAELIYFTDHKHPTYTLRRDEILRKLNPLDRRRIALERAFHFKTSETLFNANFGSTIRRMEPFLDITMQMMFGLKTGVDFRKMVTDGWLIVANLDYLGVSPDFDNRHQRIIGTAIINEIFYAVNKLRDKGWKGYYYLYIDEVGDYATRNISTILDKKSKTGLRLTAAHQRFAQLEDQYVRDAVLTGMNNKVLFQTANPADVIQMAKMMYGGDLPATKVEFVLRQLAKQHAAIKIEKSPAVFTRIANVRGGADGDLESFKAKIYKQDFYHSPEEILKEINERFKTKSTIGTPKPRRTNAKDSSPEEGPRDTPIRTVFDDLTDSPSVLRRQTRRKPSGPSDDKAQGKG